MPHVETMRNADREPVGILVDNWSTGQHVTVTATAAFTAAFATSGAVKVRNKTNKLVYVRTDGQAASSDGTSDELDPYETDMYAITSTDGRISLMAADADPAITGYVHCLGMKGAR